MIHDKLWMAAGMADGFLCIGCLEGRLGRTLTPRDFKNVPINVSTPWDTPRLAVRKGPRFKHSGVRQCANHS